MATVSDNDNEKLLSTLKKHAPSRVRVICGDDVREVAVPQRRRRWPQVIAAIEARPWSTVELLDKAGAVLAYCENDGAAGPIEDLGAGRGGAVGEAERIVALVLRGQEAAYRHRDAEMRAVLQAQGDIVRECGSAMKALTAIYQAQVDAASEVATLQAQASGDGVVRELLEAAPQILQMLPVLRGLAGGKAS